MWPFNVTSETTNTVVWSVDNNGNVIQAGTLLPSGLLLPAGAAPALGPGQIGLYNNGGTLATVGPNGSAVPLAPSGGLVAVEQASPPAANSAGLVLYTPDGNVLSVVTPSGTASPVAFGGAYAPVIGTSPTTITGVTAATLLAGGITIPAGGLAAGQAYRFDAWGTVTTTVDTQTVALGLYLGGVAGTSLLNFGAQQVDSSAPVTNAAWSVSFEATLISATEMGVWGWDALNFFFSGTTRGTPTVAIATAKQLVIGVTPSATAVSITCDTFACTRIA